VPGEERRQRRDNVGDEVVVDKREPVGYRHSPELPWDSLAEAYAEGWLGLHIHFRTGTVEGGIAGGWCAAFNKAEHQFDVVDCQVVGNEKGRAHLREKTDVRQPVLVFDVKPVELPETVFLDSVLSMVRLQPLDDCLRGWRGAPNHVLAFARELASILEMGNCSLLSKSGGTRPP
jgi:hypothetical protein